MQTSSGKWKWGSIERDTKGELAKTVYGIWIANGKKGKFEDFWHYKGKNHSKPKTESFKYSFIAESLSECDEHDLEWISDILNRTRYEIEHCSDGDGDDTHSAIDKAQGLILKSINNLKQQGYSDKEIKFRKTVVNIINNQINHLEKLDEYGGYISNDIWAKIFDIKYITWLVNHSRRQELISNKLET